MSNEETMPAEYDGGEFEGVQVHGETPNEIIASGGAMMQTRTQYTTAIEVRKPRNLDAIVEAMKAEAQYAGDSFYYAWPQGGSRIEGPSIVLAMSIARAWGNCHVCPGVGEETDRFIDFYADFVDLETGFTLRRFWRQPKDVKLGGKFDKSQDQRERKQAILFQIGQSKAIRNVIVKSVPLWLVGKCIEQAKEAVRREITKDGIEAATRKALAALADIGVDKGRVIAKLGKPQNMWIIEDIETLRTAYAAIKNGEDTALNIFPALPETQPQATAPTAKDVLDNPKPASTEPIKPSGAKKADKKEPDKKKPEAQDEFDIEL